MNNLTVHKVYSTLAKKCEICNCDFIDEYGYQGHCQGKKHLRNVQQMERTIFVGGIPQYVSPKAVAHFLHRFGEVQFFRPCIGGLILEFKNK